VTAADRYYDQDAHDATAPDEPTAEQWAEWEAEAMAERPADDFPSPEQVAAESGRELPF